MSRKQHEIIKLEIFPTVFQDLNQKLGNAPSTETTEIIVRRMKHKHIRVMQTMSEPEQVHYIMSELTGLSADDLDELDAEDSAALSEIIFGFMRKYTELAKQLVE